MTSMNYFPYCTTILSVCELFVSILLMTEIMIFPACPMNTFQCDETRCLPISYRCDAVVQCQDQQDENNCGEYDIFH